MSRRTFTASELRIDLDKLPAAPRSTPSFVYLDGVKPWSMIDHARAFLGETACPVCHNRKLRRNLYCSACDAAGLDGRITYPGLPIGSCCDPNWSATPTSYTERPLKRGLGDLVAKRKRRKQRALATA